MAKKNELVSPPGLEHFSLTNFPDLKKNTSEIFGIQLTFNFLRASRLSSFTKFPDRVVILWYFKATIERKLPKNHKPFCHLASGVIELSTALLLPLHLVGIAQPLLS